VFTYPRLESPPPPPLWMGVVTGLACLGALVALMSNHYRIADVAIIAGNLVFLLLFIRRHRERRRQANEPPCAPDGEA
jgi:hypothetical protein